MRIDPFAPRGSRRLAEALRGLGVDVRAIQKPALRESDNEWEIVILGSVLDRRYRLRLPISPDMLSAEVSMRARVAAELATEIERIVAQEIAEASRA